MRFRFIFFLLSLVKISFSQDSVAYGRDFILNEGLYLQYSDFRHNWPIPKEKIISNINKDQLDFYGKLIENNDIEYVERDGNRAKIKAGNVWGFCQNNVVYINYKRNFYRVPVFGAICYFMAKVPVSTYSPAYGGVFNVPAPQQYGTTQAWSEFIMDFYTGELVEFSLEKLDELLKKDDSIYKEYSALSKKKKRDQASRFIRKFNESHPVYFPKY